MKQFSVNLMLFLGLLAFAQNAQAQATLSIQGVLQNFNGTAVDNGQYDITFRLYTTDAGGTALWSETQTVPVTGGVYSVLLGDVNPLNVPFDQTYYLGLTIPGGPEHTPRARLTSSPYALSLIGQDNKFPSTGNVGIGTATPTAKLQVDGSTVLNGAATMNGATTMNGALATETTTTSATSYTVAATDHVIFLDHTANQNVTLPAASGANAQRHLMLVNRAAVAKTLTSSNYVDLLGATSTAIPANSAIELQSDGSAWRQTGGYVTPTTQAKAYVRCLPTGQNNFTSEVTVLFTESSDAQNCFNNNTFTAPRTGTYRISGALYYEISSISFTATPYLTLVPSGGGNPYYLDASVFSPVGGIPRGVFSYSIDLPLTQGQTLVLKYTIFGALGTIYAPGIGSAGYLTITEN